MLASQLITETYPPLKLTDSLPIAIEILLDTNVRHLPVVAEGFFVGLISLKKLIQAPKSAKKVGDLHKDFVEISVLPDEPTEDVLSKMVSNNLSLLPVVSNNKYYLGALSRHRLLQVLVKWMGIDHPGGVLVFHMGYYDYELGQIARLAESNNAKILSLWVSEPDENMNMSVYVKYNLNDLTHIIATYNRFGFQITASYHKSDINDLLDERLQALMHFINL